MKDRQRIGFGLMIMNLGVAIIVPNFGVGDITNLIIALIGYIMFVWPEE
jgi:hypothetical protein